MHEYQLLVALLGTLLILFCQINRIRWWKPVVFLVAIIITSPLWKGILQTALRFSGG